MGERSLLCDTSVGLFKKRSIFEANNGDEKWGFYKNLNARDHGVKNTSKTNNHRQKVISVCLVGFHGNSLFLSFYRTISESIMKCTVMN